MGYILSPRARRDLRDVRRGPFQTETYLPRVLLRLNEVLDSLSSRPYQGRLERDGARAKFVSGTPYLVVYSVRDDGDVLILRIHHTARAAPDRWI